MQTERTSEVFLIQDSFLDFKIDILDKFLLRVLVPTVAQSSTLATQSPQGITVLCIYLSVQVQADLSPKNFNTSTLVSRAIEECFSSFFSENTSSQAAQTTVVMDTLNQ